MTLTIPEAGMSSLRQAAEAAEDATGLRAEIIRGTLMMSPTPRLKHGVVINAFYDQLRPALGNAFTPLQVASVPLPHDPDDYATPDLVVCATAAAESDDWLVEPDSVLEVVSTGNSAKDPRIMVDWYAEAGIPACPVVDPRDGTWTLHTVPRDGTYQGVLHGLYGLYGEEIELAGLGVTLATEGLPRYGEAGPGGQTGGTRVK